MSIWDHTYNFIDFECVELSFGSTFTPSPWGAKNRAQHGQNQFTPLGVGVNKLIFNRFK